MANTDDQDAKAFAKKIRSHCLRMVHNAKASHVGSCLSSADILAVLFARVLRIDPDKPLDPDRDRFIMSKGHAAAILYAALAERGFIPVSELDTYCKDGSRLTGHITHAVPGVEFSTGSLGHGLSVGAGFALAARAQGQSAKAYALLSDGECDEGSTWEAILFAAHHRLSNLIAIVDYNKIQSFGRTNEVLNLEPFADKWRSFNWRVIEVNGHDLAELEGAVLSAEQADERPLAIIAHTVKGRGVSYMEDKLEWHYKSPDSAQLAEALREIAAS
jgi:transketolase